MAHLSGGPSFLLVLGTEVAENSEAPFCYPEHGEGQNPAPVASLRMTTKRGRHADKPKKKTHLAQEIAQYAQLHIFVCLPRRVLNSQQFAPAS